MNILSTATPQGVRRRRRRARRWPPRPARRSPRRRPPPPPAATPLRRARSAGPAVRRSKRSPATSTGSGATFPKAFYDEAIAELEPTSPPTSRSSTRGGGSGKGRTDLQEQVVDFAGTDAPVKDEDIADVQGRRVRLRPDRASPRSRCRTTSPASTTLQAHAGHDRRDLPARDHQLERPGDRRRQPRRRRCPTSRSSSCAAPTARAPPRTSPSSSTPPSAPDGDGTWTLGTGSELEWPEGTQAGDGNSGVAQIITDTAGRDRLRRPRATPSANGFTFANGPEQGRQLRRPDARGDDRGRRRTSTINDDLHVLHRLGRRRRRLPDRRPDLDHRLHHAGRRRHGRGDPRAS